MKNPPLAEKRPVSATYHGVTLTDDYAWLRQSNWQEMFRDTTLLDPDIRAYLEAENEFTRRQLIEPNAALIDKIVAEMKSVIEIDFDTAGTQDGPWRYFERHSAQDYPVFLRRGDDGREETLLDPNTEFAGKKVFLADIVHSPDHQYLAVAVDFTGSEDTDLHIKDLASGKFVERLAHAGEPVWAPDGKSLYYAKMKEGGALQRHYIYRHILGTAQEQDRLIFEKPRDGFYLSIAATTSRRFLKISMRDNAGAEIHVLDFDNPNSGLVCLAPYDDKIRYTLDHHDGHFYILTNADGATDFKIMRAPTDAPQRENWTEWEPHKPGRYIEKILCFENHLVRLERADALPHAIVTDLRNGKTGEISFDETAYDLGIGAAAGFYGGKLRLNYSSPRQPTQETDYDLETGARHILREEKIAGHNPEDYIVERLHVSSHDGAQVPVTVTRHKDTKLDGSAPVFLYGYGSYGAVMPSGFGWFKKRYPLLKRGFVTAVAHIRGGAACGFGWYEDGKMMKKKNSFLDFIACAEFLADRNYTSRGKIAIEGASAGGMLMGAAVNMAPPDLFGAVVAGVPFIDVMHTMTDASLPLTPPEWEEWGNPIEDKAAFEYMLSYSPYDNITARAYPPMLITGGLTDPRVTYWEPAKYVAKLRALKTDDHPLYLHIEMESGHFGDPGRFGRLPELARDLCFIIRTVGNFCAGDLSDEEWQNPENKGCCG